MDARRDLRFRRQQRERARRHHGRGRQAQGVDACRSQRFPVYARSHQRKADRRESVREVNWAERIDPKTARPVETEVAKRLRAGEKVEVRPRWTGGKNWMPMAFNPNTGRLYLASLEENSVYQLNKEVPVYKAAAPYIGVEN